MATFVTGATGYLGSYIAAALLKAGENVFLLVRSKGKSDAERRLWRALQLHMDFPTFRGHLEERIAAVPGDLTAPRFGLEERDHETLLSETDSIVHCAASLNRRSERSCLNVNLRGTLAMVLFARAAQRRHGLRRFTHVSTVSVAGERLHETVSEDGSLDWNRRDYDPYSRTKKFGEALVRELLPDVPFVIVRPSIVLGDSSRVETTQFEMARAFSFLASLPVLPFRPLDRLDIVPADWVSEAIVTLHRAEENAHDTYHLSAGEASETYLRLTDVVSKALGRTSPTFIPLLGKSFLGGALLAARFGSGNTAVGAKLLAAFFPYLTYDTVFDNGRITAETGRRPTPFSSYCVPLLDFARRCRFEYPYAPWPEERRSVETIRLSGGEKSTRGGSEMSRAASS